MEGPHLRVEHTGKLTPVRGALTTIGCGHGVDVRLDEASVSQLHAELVRRGPYLYVVDLGSCNGTLVYGRPLARRVLADGDALIFEGA